jgi:hypothetical protein
MTSNSIFSTSFIKHQGVCPLTFEDLGFNPAEFGVVVNKVTEMEMDKTPTLLSITIDNSGSMQYDRKMHHVIQTVTNLIHTIVKKRMPVSILINAFNDTFEPIVELTDVIPETTDEILTKLKGVLAGGSTDIECAITHSQQRIEPYLSIFAKIHHFFLTDGHPNMGEVNHSKLAELVSSEYPTTFIGYGDDHNYQLLTECSKKHDDSSYQLVDDYRHIGILCGELLHTICYPALTGVTLHILYDIDSSLFVFDEKAHTFVNAINLGTFISGKEYRTPANLFERNVACIIHTSGILPGSTKETVDTELHVIKTSSNSDTQTADLTSDIFRFAVNRAMYHTRTNGIDANGSHLKQLYKKIRVYARQRGLLDTTFYKLLFDDLYASYSSEFDNMYLHARIISNGRNQSFRSSSNGRDYSHGRGGLRRQVAGEYDTFDSMLRENAVDTQYEFDDDESATPPDDNDESADEDDIESYIPANVQNDTNNTQTMCDVIRDVSMS